MIGNRTKIKVVKNKVAPPFRSCEVDLLYGQGISTEGSLLDMAVQKDIIQKAGAWFSYKDQRIGQGRDNTRIFLKEHPEITAEIERTLRQEFEESMTVNEDANSTDIPEMPEYLLTGDEN